MFSFSASEREKGTAVGTGAEPSRAAGLCPKGQRRLCVPSGAGEAEAEAAGRGQAPASAAGGRALLLEAQHWEVLTPLGLDCCTHCPEILTKVGFFFLS